MADYTTIKTHLVGSCAVADDDVVMEVASRFFVVVADDVFVSDVPRRAEFSHEPSRLNILSQETCLCLGTWVCSSPS